MLLRIMGAIAVIAGAAAVCALPMSAATAQTSQSEPAATTTTGKPLTARQQKMKDCAAKWKEEKAEKHVAGRDAYRAFMKGCLKN